MSEIILRMWPPPQWFLDALLSVTGLALIVFLISKRVFEYGKLVAEIRNLEQDREKTRLEIEKLTTENEHLKKRSLLETEKLELELNHLRTQSSRVALSLSELDRFRRWEPRGTGTGSDSPIKPKRDQYRPTLYPSTLIVPAQNSAMDLVEMILLGLLAATLVLTLLSRIF